MSTENNFVKIGKLNTAFGLKGHLRIFIEPEMVGRLKKRAVFFVEIKNNRIPYFQNELDLADSGHGMIHFEDVNDKTTADTLVGRNLYVEEKALKKLKPLFMLRDYIGFRLQDELLGDLGVLDDLMELPQHEVGQFIFEGKEILFPFNDEVVKKIDKRQKTLFISLPKGILDVYLKK